MMHYVSALGVRCTEIVVVGLRPPKFGPLLQVQLPGGCELHSVAGWQEPEDMLDTPFNLSPAWDLRMRNYIILYRDDQEEVAGAGDGDGVIDTYIILHILTQDNPTNLAHERCGEQRADSVFQVSLGWALESQACLGVSGPRACMLRKGITSRQLARYRSDMFDMFELRTRFYLYICTVCLVVGRIMS